ncbi:MAG: hypothetical protein WCG34_04145 [Leptolinea sp.]
MKQNQLYFFLSLIILTAISACNGLGLKPGIPTVTAAPTSIPTAAPTATPSASRVALVAPPEIRPEEVKTVADAIQPVIAEAGFIVETVAQAPAGSLGPNRVAAIFLSAPPNLVEILAANPQTQIIVVSGNDFQPGANLTILRVHPEFQAFMAGYVAVLAAPNWRVAGLVPYDGGETNLMANAFASGGRYFCGRCGTTVPPFAPYPLTESAPRNASPVEWQAAAANILPAGIEVVYFSKEAQSPELIQSLASQNLLFMGSVSPGDGLRDRWVATISQDTAGALAKILPDVLKGLGGKVMNVGVALTDINEAIITTGKQRLITETNEQLMKGWINPYTVSN